MKHIQIVMTLVLVGLLAAACKPDPGVRGPFTVGPNGWIFEGWACAPDAALGLKGLSPAQYCEGKKKEYLYVKFSARASDKAIRANSPGMKQSTCREASRLQVAADGLAKIIGEEVRRASGTSDGQSTGVAIIAQTKGIMNGVGIYDCCAVDADTGLCTKLGKKEDWKECQCVGYMKFPGGQKGLVTTAKRIREEN